MREGVGVLTGVQWQTRGWVKECHACSISQGRADIGVVEATLRAGIQESGGGQPPRSRLADGPVGEGPARLHQLSRAALHALRGPAVRGLRGLRNQAATIEGAKR
jgi:hypothetical protein